MLHAGPISNLFGGGILSSLSICYSNDNLLKEHLYFTKLTSKMLPFFQLLDRIGVVMVSVLASNAVDRGLRTGRVKQKTIELVFVGCPLSIHR